MRIVLASGLLLAAQGGVAMAADKVQVGDKGVFPESLTSTADGTLIVGSVGGGWDMPVAVTKVGQTLWVVEAKFSKMGGTEDPGAFYAYPVTLQ